MMSVSHVCGVHVSAEPVLLTQVQELLRQELIQELEPKPQGLQRLLLWA
jgi:hypothetical protein